MESQTIDNLGGYSAAVYRKLVRTAAENTWGRFANITFVDPHPSTDTGEWSSCDSAAPANTLALEFTIGQEQVGVGSSALVPTLLRLRIPNSDPNEFVERAVRAFGVALGIIPSDYAGDLKPEHIAAAVQIYGTKHGGALVGWGGHCLDVDRAPDVREFNLDLVAKDCEERAPQVWRPYEIPGAGIAALLVRYDFAGYCATIFPNSTTLQTGGCDLGLNWSLPLQNMRWRGWGNLCVTASSNQVGATLALAPCTDLAFQRWELFENWLVNIRLSGTSLCVAGHFENGDRLGALTLASCDVDAREQGFDLSAHSLVRYDRGICVASLGDALVLAPTCDDTLPEQSFYVSGVIQSSDVSGCLSLSDPPVPGSVAQLVACDTNVSPTDNLPFWQDWDYHW